MANPAMKRFVCSLASGVRFGDNRRFPLRRWMFNDQIEAAPAQWIAQPAFLIRSEKNVRNRRCLHGPQFGNGKRPGREQLEQHRFKGIVDLVDFVDQQDAGLFVLDRFQQRTGHEIGPAAHFPFDLGPIRSLLALARQQHVKLLEALVVLPDGLIFVDTLVALEAKQGNLIGAREFRTFEPVLHTSGTLSTKQKVQVPKL